MVFFFWMNEWTVMAGDGTDEEWLLVYFTLPYMHACIHKIQWLCWSICGVYVFVEYMLIYVYADLPMSMCMCGC